MRRRAPLALPAEISREFPATIGLPAGFAPEGIAIAGGAAYLGSRSTGSIYRADLATGAGAIVHIGRGAAVTGLAVDAHDRAFLAGPGAIRVAGLRTGGLLASYPAPGPAFVNDVVLTRDAAWFTDAFRATLYRLPRTPGAAVAALPLTGITITAGTVNVNGICATPDGRALLVVQSNTGLLFRVDPVTGAATRVGLGGATVVNGDGLLLAGHTLHVVRNRANAVDMFRLNRAGTAGIPAGTITDPRLAGPTAAASCGDRLYVVNARLGTPIGPAVAYDVVAVRRPSDD